MGLIDNLNSWVKSKVVGWLEAGASEAYTNRSGSMVSRRSYRLGLQRRFLRNSREGFDDNVIGNFLGLALDRGISLLFGKPVEFEWDEGVPDETVEFINNIWEANNKPILLHKLAMYGGEDGTVFVKLVPDDEKGWRIVAQDPIFKDILCDPDDDDKVIQYTTQYRLIDLSGKEVSKRETITIGNYVSGTEAGIDGKPILVIEQGDPYTIPANWLIQVFISSRDTGGKWRLESQEIWPYPLPPIIHWQNLPMVGSVWGMPDISDDVVELQDKSNFAISNTNKILRLFAHPFRWSRGFGGRRTPSASGGDASLDVGPDQMPNKDDPAAEIFQLAPVGDIPGAVGHATNLRQIIFDVTRNTDITSMKDKVGGLTNFGLRILFYDALAKLETKRGLYGWGLREINRRLLMFSGLDEPMTCDIIWQDPLPVDQRALRENSEADLRMGVASKQTISERLGYDWETEQARLEEQQVQGDNIGAAILRAFDRNGGEQPAGGLVNNAIRTQPVASQPR